MKDEKEGKKRKDPVCKVYYDADGNVCDVELTKEGLEKGCKIIAKGKDITPEFIRDKISEYPSVDIKSHQVIKPYGNSGCIIYLNNYSFCICNCK